MPTAHDTAGTPHPSCYLMCQDWTRTTASPWPRYVVFAEIPKTPIGKL